MSKGEWNWISAGFALAAAIAWIISAVQKLPDVPTQQFHGVSNAGVPHLIKKLRIQSAWSAGAAILAAAAAITQACGLLFAN